jgi:pimeloyl-ACP methyl ester carboxylesterase
MNQGQREAQELTHRAFTELADASGGIGSIHRAVADRIFTYVGPQGAPARMAHDTISAGVYGALHGAFRAAGAGAGALAGRRDGEPLSQTPRGAAVIAAINGLIGDRLEEERSALVQPMAIRVDGVAFAPEEIEVGPRVAVFLHGLMETEFSWSLGGREPYGAQLERDLGYTPIYVRYNSGRHISENGASFAELMEALDGAHEIETIALIGHSMGGLVARSAAHRGGDWTTKVRHVVSLGSPHMGAPLEQAVHYASAALHKLPETRPFGAFLRRRSSGIRDLRGGSLVDEDWRDRDRDALKAAALAEVPLLENATHCFVAATITRDANHPVGRLLGDILVLSSSASGRSRTRRLDFKDEDGLQLGGANHFVLLNHPKVYAQLRKWLAAGAKAGQKEPAPAGA